LIALKEFFKYIIDSIKNIHSIPYTSILIKSITVKFVLQFHHITVKMYATNFHKFNIVDIFRRVFSSAINYTAYEKLIKNKSSTDIS